MCKIEINGQLKEFSKYSDKKIESIGEKYKSIFDREDKTKILDKIKTDISVKYKDISLLELEILSNNIYEYCCLTKNNISQDEILKYLLAKNNFYNNFLTNNTTEKLITILNINVKFLNLLVKRYMNC